MTIIRPETSPYVAAYKAGVDTTEPLWLQARRQLAIERFAALGLPTRRQEAWRFTNLRHLTLAALLPDPARASAAELPPDARPYPGLAYRLLLDPAAPTYRPLDLPAGVWFGTVAQALESRPDLLKSAFDAADPAGEPFHALNAAMFKTGFVLAVERGVAVATPFEVVHVNRGAATHARCAILLGAGASATLLESFSGSGAGWTNSVTRIELSPGASLRHCKTQNEAAAAIHLAATQAVLAERASYDSLVLSFGALLSREDIQVSLAGQEATFTLNGAYLLGGDQEAAFVPVVTHAVPGCESRQTVKGVIGGRAHGIFLGTIRVRPGADQTDARQTNRNLLLNPGATVDTRPELEILADDVKCSHGATIGDLDEAALFYLQSRGIETATARRMLVEAFAADVIESSTADAPIRAHLHQLLSAWLEALA